MHPYNSIITGQGPIRVTQWNWDNVNSVPRYRALIVSLQLMVRKFTLQMVKFYLITHPYR